MRRSQAKQRNRYLKGYVGFPLETHKNAGKLRFWNLSDFQIFHKFLFLSNDPLLRQLIGSRNPLQTRFVNCATANRLQDTTEVRSSMDRQWTCIGGGYSLARKDTSARRRVVTDNLSCNFPLKLPQSQVLPNRTSCASNHQIRGVHSHTGTV